MLGAAGALCCLAAGTAMGSWLRIRRMTRYGTLQSALDMLAAMRLLLETERLSLPELLEGCADHTGAGDGAEKLSARLMETANTLRIQPLGSIAAAYESACAQHPMPWEQTEERDILQALFQQLGTGTAAMREQAVAACIRRLKPLCEQTRTDAEKGGKLCMQLGMLLGLMAGIALW